MDDLTYKKVSALVDEWLALHQGETFDLDTICRQLTLTEREPRNLITIKLAYEVKRGNLEKNSRTYKYVNKDKKYIRYLEYKDNDEIEISWPYDHASGARFGFDGHIALRPADLIVVAGLSNWGKSAFCRNFIAENMDKYKCQMMVNEYSPGRFAGVIRRMKWADWKNPDGTEKAPLIERHEDWQHIIEPDWINVIDWISLADNFYLIRQIMEGI